MSAKNVLITGADGFIGSHLTELIVKKGYRVKALSYYNSFNNWGWLEEISCLKDIEVVSGDVRDAFFCNAIMKGIDIVFNLAALIAIPYSYVAPQSYVDTNINGCLNICQAALQNSVGRVVQISTSEVYGTAQYVPIDEKHPLQPQSPYSASKIGADSLALSHYNAFELPVVVARPFNTYGPRQSARAFIPTIITQLANGAKEVKLGDTTPTRDLNYVLDTCNGLSLLGEANDVAGQVINIGSNTEYSIKEIFDIIQDIMGTNADIITDKDRIRPAKSEVKRLCCDNAKIKSLVGYEPGHDIKMGLKKTIEWFTKKENLSKYKADIYNV